jgi:ASC-1-like (ASCH) protein
MNKSWRFIDKILHGQKTIESRWYKSKRLPWNSIKADETIYFKNSGGLIELKANVSKVIQFSDLNQDKVLQILNEYYEPLGILKDEINVFYERFKDKKYCVLIFLENPQSVKPFNINKKGFGMMSAWITVEAIENYL